MGDNLTTINIFWVKSLIVIHQKTNKMIKLELNNQFYNIPENADELSLDRYDRIRILIQHNTISGVTAAWTYNSIIQVIECMTDISPIILEEAPMSFFETIFKKIEWVFSFDADNYKPKDYIDWEGERYSYEPTHDWFVKEWVDWEAVSKSFPEHEKFSCLLAIKLRKKLKDKNGKYIDEVEKYDSELIEKRKDMFKKMPISNVIPLIGFFLLKDKLLKTNLSLYSTEVALALTRHQVMLDWVKNGDGFKRLSGWRKTIYLKWMKFLSEELSKHLTLYHTVSMSQTHNTKQLNTNNN